MEKIEKIVLAGAVISQDFCANQVKQVEVNGVKVSLNPFNARKIEPFLNAVTGAGQVATEIRKQHLEEQLNMNKHNKVVNALCISASGFASANKENQNKADKEICQ